jgi:imidazolonepropionase-like amidohydrolase
VLAAATTNFDEAYGFNLVGAIKPGYQSDAVVLHKDPTADVNIHDSIDAVVRSGRYLRRNEILVPRA